MSKFKKGDKVEYVCWPWTIEAIVDDHALLSRVSDSISGNGIKYWGKQHYLN